MKFKVPEASFKNIAIVLFLSYAIMGTALYMVAKNFIANQSRYTPEWKRNIPSSEVRKDWCVQHSRTIHELDECIRDPEMLGKEHYDHETNTCNQP